MQPIIQAFFDPATWTVSYVVYEKPGTACAIVDSVLDYDPKSGRTHTASADKLVAFVREHQLQVAWILETHAHADHLSAAAWLKPRLGAKVGIGAGIRAVQSVFKPIFGIESDFPTDGSQFDRLFADGDRLTLGALEIEVIATPGHTSDSLSYRIGDAVFVGDSLFLPDAGSARCDFPGGDAGVLYDSIQRLFALPDQTRVFVCHDYGAGGRAPQAQTTIAEQKTGNIHARAAVSREDFVAMRRARDATLALPALILPAVQINIRAGELPPPDENGRRYLRLPLDTL